MSLFSGYKYISKVCIVAVHSNFQSELNMKYSKRHDPYPVKDPYRGIYAHGVETEAQARQVFVSGQVGVSPDGKLGDGFRSQCEQAINNVIDVLRVANMRTRDIVKMTFYLTRAEDMDTLVEVRKTMLEGVRPAITTVFVCRLVDKDWLIEVEAIAADYQGQSLVSKLM